MRSNEAKSQQDQIEKNPAAERQKLLVNNSLEHLRELVATGATIISELLHEVANSIACGFMFDEKGAAPIDVLPKLHTSFSTLELMLSDLPDDISGGKNLELKAMELVRAILSHLPSFESDLQAIISRASEYRRGERTRQEKLENDTWAEGPEFSALEYADHEIKQLSEAVTSKMLRCRTILELALESNGTILDVAAGFAARGYRVGSNIEANIEIPPVKQNALGIAIGQAISIVESCRNKLAAAWLSEPRDDDGSAGAHIDLKAAKELFSGANYNSKLAALADLSKCSEPLTIAVSDSQTLSVDVAIPASQLELAKTFTKLLATLLVEKSESFAALDIKAEVVSEPVDDQIYTGIKLSIHAADQPQQSLLSPKASSYDIIDRQKSYQAPLVAQLPFRGKGSLEKLGDIPLDMPLDFFDNHSAIPNFGSLLARMVAITGHANGIGSVRLYHPNDGEQPRTRVELQVTEKLKVTEKSDESANRSLLRALEILEVATSEQSLLLRQFPRSEPYNRYLEVDDEILGDMASYQALYNLLADRIYFSYANLIDLLQLNQGDTKSDTAFVAQVIKDLHESVSKTREPDAARESRFVAMQIAYPTAQSPGIIRALVADQDNIAVGRAYIRLLGSSSPNLAKSLERIPDIELRRLTEVLHSSIEEALRTEEFAPSGTNQTILHVMNQLELNAFSVSPPLLTQMIEFCQLSPSLPSISELRQYLNQVLVGSEGSKLSIAPWSSYKLAILCPEDRIPKGKLR